MRLAPARRAFALATTLAALASAAIAAPSASAAVYCVDMGAACPSGGTASASLAVAITAANAAADEDFVYLGATTQSLPGPVSDSARPLHLIGSGRGVSNINLTSNAFISIALNISGADSTVSGLTLRNSSASGTGTALAVDGIRGASAHDLRIESDFYGASLSNGASLANSDVAVPMGGVTNCAVRPFSGSANLEPITITDSRLRGAIGICGSMGDSIDVTQSHVTYSLAGASLSATSPGSNQSNTATLRMSDSVVQLEAQGAGASSTFAFSVVADADSDAGKDVGVGASIDVQRTTVSGLGQTGGVGVDTVAYVASDASQIVSPGTISHSAKARISFDGVAVVGSFDESVRRLATSIGGNTSAASDVTIDRSNIDLSAGKVQPLGPVSGTLLPNANTATVFWRTDLGFADQANGDYRLVRSSPLVDAGGSVGSDSVDFAGGVRPVSAPGSTPRFDIGAHEYQFAAPSVTATGPGAAVTPGTPIAFSATATDSDPGETATLAYTWSLPGGATPTGAAVATTAPATLGTQVVTVAVTDAAGITTTVPVTYTVVAAPVAVPPGVVPADKLAPMVLLPKLKFSLKALLKRAPVAVKLELSEAATVRSTAVVVVSQPGKTRFAKRKLVKVTVGTSAATALGAGNGSFKVVPSKVGIAKLAKAMKVRGTRVASITLSGTVTDAAGNRRAFSTPVSVGK